MITYQLSTQGKITLKNLIIAGLIVGLGVGLKLTTAIYGLALIFTVNVIGNNLKEKIIYTFSVGSSMFAGFLLIAGYWIMLMWTNFRNPLFPFFNKVFKSPYIETEESLKDLRFLPRDIWQTLFYPFHFLTNPNLVAEVKFRDIRLALAYLLIVILIATFIYRLWQGKTAKANPLINQSVFSLLIAFYVVSYIIWQSQFSIYRYLIVLELLTPVLIVFIISYLYPVEKKILLISFFLFVLIMTTVKPMDWWRISWSSDYFGIDRNSLIKYNNSVIVMSGDHPTSYLVPHFPTTTRFVRVTGNAGLSLNTLMRKNAEEIIRNTPENSLYILEIDLAGVDLEKQQRQQTEALSRMDLKVNDATCQPLSTLVGEYRICQLHRGQ